MSTPISTNFTKEELTTTRQRYPDGSIMHNEPDAVAATYLPMLAWTALEPIRALLNCPLIVTSGYRGPDVERSVQEHAGIIAKGAPLAPSQHALGQAADIVPVGDMSVEEAYDHIFHSTIPYDQLLLEGPPGAQWIHVSITPTSRPPRRQALASVDGLHFHPYVSPTAGQDA